MLNRLLGLKEITAERADDLKHRYEEVHAALIGVMAAEKNRLDDAKALKRRVDLYTNKDTSTESKEENSDMQAALQVQWSFVTWNTG